MTRGETELARRLYEACERMIAKGDLLTEAMEALCRVMPGEAETDAELIARAQAHARETRAHAARLLQGVPVIEEAA